MNARGYAQKTHAHRDDQTVNSLLFGQNSNGHSLLHAVALSVGDRRQREARWKESHMAYSGPSTLSTGWGQGGRHLSIFHMRPSNVRKALRSNLFKNVYDQTVNSLLFGQNSNGHSLLHAVALSVGERRQREA